MNTAGWSAKFFASLPLKYSYGPSWPPEPGPLNAFRSRTREFSKSDWNKTKRPSFLFWTNTTNRTCYTVNSLQHTKLRSNCTTEEWTEERSAAWAKPWTSRAHNQHQGCGAPRALSIDYPSVDTDIPHPVLMHIADIIWEALGLSRGCSHVRMSCQLTSCTEGDDGNASTWPFWKETKSGVDGVKLPPHTRTDAASVKRFGLPLRGRRFCSTTWHSVQRFKDWIHDQQCHWGLGDTPRLCCSYGDYQVIMHAFIYLFNTSLRGVHIIIIYILGFIMLAKNETPTSTHTGDTPESFRPHTNFGMAVGSMQTWNLSLDCSPIQYISSPIIIPRVYGIIPVQSCHGASKAPRESLTLRHWRYCGGYPHPLLQSCDNSCIIAQKKAHYEHLSSNQSYVAVSCCCCCCCYGHCANDSRKKTQTWTNTLLSCCEASDYSSWPDGSKTNCWKPDKVKVWPKNSRYEENSGQ